MDWLLPPHQTPNVNCYHFTAFPSPSPYKQNRKDWIKIHRYIKQVTLSLNRSNEYQVLHSSLQHQTQSPKTYPITFVCEANFPLPLLLSQNTEREGHHIVLLPFPSPRVFLSISRGTRRDENAIPFFFPMLLLITSLQPTHRKFPIPRPFSLHKDFILILELIFFLYSFKK